jgi:hypothetical protein
MLCRRAPLVPIIAARCEALTLDRGASYFSLGPVQGEAVEAGGSFARLSSVCEQLGRRAARSRSRQLARLTRGGR